MNQMFCFRCDKEFRSAVYQGDDDKFFSQPGGGLEFTTRGHYGSAFWDPMPPQDTKEYLVLYLCDECLADNEQRVYYKTSKFGKDGAGPHVDIYVSGKEVKMSRIIET